MSGPDGRGGPARDAGGRTRSEEARRRLVGAPEASGGQA